VPGVLQNTRIVELEVNAEVDEGELIAYALELCPPGQAIEVHAPYCDVFPCSCIPRVIQKPMAS
jgi:hypothetical protein